jgi:hypothetical protein
MLAGRSFAAEKYEGPVLEDRAFLTSEKSMAQMTVILCKLSFGVLHERTMDESNVLLRDKGAGTRQRRQVGAARGELAG